MMRDTFAHIVPGDLFTLHDHPVFPVRGVCVIAPEVKEIQSKGFLWWKKYTTIMTARCIEIHPYQGAVEWNPVAPANTPVEIEERD